MGKEMRQMARSREGVSRGILQPETEVGSNNSPYPHPTDFAVVQYADVGHKDSADWHYFLAELGDGHRDIAKVRSLGSVGITIVARSETGKMLEDKLPVRENSRSKINQQKRKVASGLRAFLVGESKAAFEKQLITVASGHNQGRLVVLNTIEGEDEPQYQVREPIIEETYLSQDEQVQLHENNYGFNSFRTKGLKLYGGNKAGVDLSANPEPFEVRESIKGYLERYHGLNTSLMDPTWQPHATVLDFHGHIPPQAIEYDDMPTTMPFKNVHLAP